MRVCVLGAGAIGSVVGGLLAADGHDITLVGRASHMDAIRKEGLRVSGIWGDHLVRRLDCHTSVGLMGDGERHRHKEQQVDVACTDCHGDEGPARTAPLHKSELAAIAVGRFLHGRRLGPEPRPGVMVARTGRGTPLWALGRAPGGDWVLRRRVDGRALPVW